LDDAKLVKRFVLYTNMMDAESLAATKQYMFTELDFHFKRILGLKPLMQTLCKTMLDIEEAVGDCRRGIIVDDDTELLIEKARNELLFVYKAYSRANSLVTMLCTEAVYSLLFLITDWLFILLGHMGKLNIPRVYDAATVEIALADGIEKHSHILLDTVWRLVRPSEQDAAFEQIKTALRDGGPGGRKAAFRNPWTMQRILQYCIADCFDRQAPIRETSLYDDLANYDYDLRAASWEPGNRNPRLWHVLPGRIGLFLMKQAGLSYGMDRDALQVLVEAQDPSYLWKSRLKLIILEMIVKSVLGGLDEQNRVLDGLSV
jgi:hypothetical protein